MSSASETNLSTAQPIIESTIKPIIESTAQPTAASTAKPIIESTSKITTTNKPPDTINFRLPDNLKPYLYELEIQPFLDPNNFRFNGKMKMFINCLSSTNRIVFHQQGLKINESNAKLIDLSTNNEMQMNLPFDYDSETEFVIVSLKNNLVNGKNYSLELPYSANMSNKLFGFYNGSYSFNGQTH